MSGNVSQPSKTYSAGRGDNVDKWFAVLVTRSATTIR
jgi:hypothetical protein